MNSPSGLEMLYWYLDGKYVVDGKEGIVGENEKHDLMRIAVLETATVKSLRDQELAMVQNYCALIIIVALRRLHNREARTAMIDLEVALRLLSARQDIEGQLPKNVLWAAMKIASANSGERHSAEHAARQITTSEQPDTVARLEDYIRTHLPRSS